MLQLSLMMLTTMATTPANINISVDPSAQYQTWEGFGTSLAWWAHIVGDYPEPLRTQLVDKVLGGLKLNILRYNIGGGEDPSLNFMEQRARVPGFMSPDGKYDWTADAAQRWVLDRGVHLGANKFEAFSNSPPYFMTLSGSVTGAVGGGDNLNPDKLNDFTDYLATVTKHFRDNWGIKFETLEPMNEPAANWWTYKNRQEGCHVSPGEKQNELILATQASLAKAKLSTKIAASDESLNNWAVTSWDALSTEAKAAVYRLNTHCYGGTSQHWVNHRATRDAKRLWMSEYGDGDATGMTTAHQMVKDLREMMPTAWVYWQVIDGGSGWGCIDMDLNARSQTFTVNRKYYAFAQFSQFIRPKAKFISISEPNSVCVINGSQVVIVTVSDSDQVASYDLSRFKRLGSVVSVTQTSPNQNLASLPNVPVSKKAFSVSLPAHSVTTLVINGCSFAGKTFSGFQTLKSSKSNQLLDVPGGSWDQGTELTTTASNGGFDEQWRIEGTGDGWYKLCNRDSGLYAALWDSSANHLPVLQWSDNGDTTLPWKISPQVDGTFRIDSYRYPTACLTENPSRGNGWPDVAIHDWYNGAEQKWSISPVSGLYPETSRRVAFK